MQKSIAESDILNEYRRGSHSVYKLTYHVIFVTKYRKKVITAFQRSEKYIYDSYRKVSVGRFTLLECKLLLCHYRKCFS